LNANIGSLISRVVGSTRPDTGIPTNAVLFPQAVSADVTKGSARGDLSATGSLGSGYAPFIPGANGQLQKDMRLNLQPDRLENRRELLDQFGKLQRQFETEEQYRSIDKYQEQAYRVLLSGGMVSAL